MTMDNWYDYTISNPDLMKEFEEKVYEEDETAGVCVNTYKVYGRREREHSYVRKRLFKKKMTRLFLKGNPTLNINEVDPLVYKRGIFLCFYDTSSYGLNLVSRIFVSRSGNLRIYRGEIEWSYKRKEARGDHPYSTIKGLYPKDRAVDRIINRRIRHMSLDMGSVKYSYCRKAFMPVDYGII